jgi:hypothetical protein
LPPASSDFPALEAEADKLSAFAVNPHTTGLWHKGGPAANALGMMEKDPKSHLEHSALIRHSAVSWIGSIPVSRISAPSCSISPRLFARSKKPFRGAFSLSALISLPPLRVVVKAVKMQGSLQDRIGIFLRVRRHPGNAGSLLEDFQGVSDK